MTEQDIATLVGSDAWMMRILKAAEELNLPDWWIGAGFLRNRVWDHLEGIEPTPSRDIDLVYFNPNDVAPETDWAYDKAMSKSHPFAEWEIRNQARMHYVDGHQPFTSTAHGISHWVETATCVAVKLQDGELQFLFCYGLDDLVNLIARPVKYFQTPDKISTFHDRVQKKQWRERWPSLTVVES